MEESMEATFRAIQEFSSMRCECLEARPSLQFAMLGEAKELNGILSRLAGLYCLAGVHALCTATHRGFTQGGRCGYPHEGL